MIQVKVTDLLFGTLILPRTNFEQSLSSTYFYDILLSYLSYHHHSMTTPLLIVFLIFFFFGFSTFRCRILNLLKLFLTIQLMLLTFSPALFLKFLFTTFSQCVHNQFTIKFLFTSLLIQLPLATIMLRSSILE